MTHTVILFLFPLSKLAFSSTKSEFLCFLGVRNPHFRAFRAQNRGFCALLAFGTPVFGHFEHKIRVFVRFLPLESQFSGISSTKSGFLCAFGVWNPRFRAFLAQNWHFCARAEGIVGSESVTAETLSVNVAFLQITARVSKM